VYRELRDESMPTRLVWLSEYEYRLCHWDGMRRWRGSLTVPAFPGSLGDHQPILLP
jgi:hypothetical protein